MCVKAGESPSNTTTDFAVWVMFVSGSLISLTQSDLTSKLRKVLLSSGFWRETRDEFDLMGSRATFSTQLFQ